MFIIWTLGNLRFSVVLLVWWYWLEEPWAGWEKVGNSGTLFQENFCHSWEIFEQRKRTDSKNMKREEEREIWQEMRCIQQQNTICEPSNTHIKLFYYRTCWVCIGLHELVWFALVWFNTCSTLAIEKGAIKLRQLGLHFSKGFSFWGGLIPLQTPPLLRTVAGNPTS